MAKKTSTKSGPPLLLQPITSSYSTQLLFCTAVITIISLLYIPAYTNGENTVQHIKPVSTSQTIPIHQNNNNLDHDQYPDLHDIITPHTPRDNIDSETTKQTTTLLPGVYSYDWIPGGVHSQIRFHVNRKFYTLDATNSTVGPMTFDQYIISHAYVLHFLELCVYFYMHEYVNICYVYISRVEVLCFLLFELQDVELPV